MTRDYAKETADEIAANEEALASGNVSWPHSAPARSPEGWPSGWKLVPIEPTEKMVRAATVVAPTWDDDASRRKWNAMLAAAPASGAEWERGMEDAAKECDEMAEAVVSVGKNKGDAYFYLNAAAQIREAIKEHGKAPGPVPLTAEVTARASATRRDGPRSSPSPAPPGWEEAVEQAAKIIAPEWFNMLSDDTNPLDNYPGQHKRYQDKARERAREVFELFRSLPAPSPSSATDAACGAPDNAGNPGPSQDNARVRDALSAPDAAPSPSRKEEELREALEEIAGIGTALIRSDWQKISAAIKIAKAALAGKG